MTAIVLFDIDGVIRDVALSYRRALADTVAEFTTNRYRPTAAEIDNLKSEGSWNNDWEASQELIYRYFESIGTDRLALNLDYQKIVAFFQTKYRGTDPVNWNGYICDEPLLVSPAYFDHLSAAQIPWGFFSGATKGSAEYVLRSRLQLENPLTIAMEDAPGKPDPTGLFMAIERLKTHHQNIDRLPVIYVGDTVADMHTVTRAKQQQSTLNAIGVGVLPPHISQDAQSIDPYTQQLYQAGAVSVIDNIEKLTPQRILNLVRE
jgi:HAD superfamily phosphatase